MIAKHVEKLLASGTSTSSPRRRGPDARLAAARHDPVGNGSLYVREVVGNLFGLASALLGMRRLVWAWPVSLVGNVLLFTVFVGGELSGQTGASPCGGRPGARSCSPWPASTAGGPGTARAAAPPTAARSAPVGAAGAGPAARPGRRRLRAGLRAAAPDRLVGTGHRGLDPRRVAAGDVRNGARLGGVLAGVDRGGRRRRDHARAGGLLPDRACTCSTAASVSSASSPGGAPPGWPALDGPARRDHSRRTSA